MIYDVAVVGGGIVGALILRELTRYRLNVVMLEREADVTNGASKANSGIVHGGFDPKPGTLKALLNIKGRDLMPKVADELGVYYKNNGSLVVAFDDDGEKVLEELSDRSKENGAGKTEIITGDRARELEKNLSKNVTKALLCKSSGIICPYELTVSAVGNAMDNGAKLKTDFNVDKIEYKNDIFKVYSGEKCIEARCVINAAGTGSGKVAELIGDNSITIKPVRGEYMLLDKECGDTVSMTVFMTPTKAGKGVLVSPTVDGNLLVGPTSEPIDDLDDRQTTAKGQKEVLEKSKMSVDNIDYSKVVTSFAGIRSSTEYGDFIIAPSQINKRFINVAGIDSPGLTASPAIALYVIDMLPEILGELKPNNNFQPRRTSYHYFQDLPVEEKNEIIKTDPSYGHIICRCEMVSEGEIVSVMHRNPVPTTFDGIKRRTRCGMGRCQAGFCTPKLIEIMARELNCSVYDITKSGKDSYILKK